MQNILVYHINTFGNICAVGGVQKVWILKSVTHRWFFFCVINISAVSIRFFSKSKLISLKLYVFFKMLETKTFFKKLLNIFVFRSNSSRIRFCLILT